MNSFVYELEQPVVILLSGREGKVIARAQYLRYPNSFQVEYVNGHGDVATGWFDTSELAAA
jgi:hypothetical protein